MPDQSLGPRGALQRMLCVVGLNASEPATPAAAEATAGTASGTPAVTKT